MASFCSKCVADPNLIALITSKGKKIQTCLLCGAKDVPALSVETSQLRSLFRALIRYHHSEWEYNTHMGGEGLEELFSQPNSITAYSAGWNAEAYEDVLLPLIEDGYEDPEKGVSLFSGYTDGVPNLPLRALKDDFDSALRTLESKLQTTNYFWLGKEGRSLFEPHVKHLEKTSPAGTSHFRSRIGYETRATPLMGWGETWHYKGFSGS